MTSILDVARESGVSPATVSRAMRGLDRVSDTTRARVLQVAADLHYVASPTASSLASGRTRVVGVVTPFVDRWYFSALISQIEKSIRDEGYHVLLLDLDDAPSCRRQLTHDMVVKRVDGVIVLNPLTEPEEEMLRHVALPAVTIGRTYPGWSSVRIDDASTVTAAVQHLAQLGHRDIAFIGAVDRPEAYGEVPSERSDAFIAAMRAAGLKVCRRWLRMCHWTALDATVDASALLAHDDRPTAIVAASDEMALGVLAAANRARIRVPKELSIVGVDDCPMSAVFGLTTVRQDVRTQASRASALLPQALKGRAAPPVEDVVLPTVLIPRQSSSPPPNLPARPA